MIELANCRLQLVVSRDDAPTELADVVRAAIAGGVDLVQLREKSCSTADRVAIARSLLAVTTERGVALLVNDDVAAAEQLVPAIAGVHLGQRDLPVEEARRRLGERAWIGLSTHSGAELALGAATSATHFGIGSCFATSTKSDAALLAPEELRRCCEQATRPLFAIGGITAQNVARLVELGVRRVAVSRAILAARDVGAAAAAIRAALDAARA